MNSVSLIGRFTKDPEVRYTAENLAVCGFTLAVDRMKKDEADFIRCKAFGKTAEFIEKYIHKGSKVGITGRIQTGSYVKQDGTNVYTTDVIADRIEFCDSKSTGEAKINMPIQEEEFVKIPENIDEELPFI